MHPTVVGLPCRLVLMAAHPGFPVDRPCDRQVPRAPSPHVGVTLMGKTSCAFSKGITLPSSLIRTHAPSLYPPFDFRNALIRKVFAGCCQPLLRKGSCRVGRGVTTPTPHRTGRAELPLTGSSRESFAHGGVTIDASVTR